MLELKDIKFQYHEVNTSFSIDIAKTQFNASVITCVLGKNGSGKTTVLNLLGGHLKASSGSILLEGKEITDLKAELRPTSTVFQQIGLFPHLTVKENIEIAVEPNTLFKKSATTKSKAEKILSDFNLIEFANRKPIQLSVGQQQRVAIARALSTEPKVLLLDEPTSALDFANISYLRNLLIELKQRETVPVIIIVSHDLPFVMSVADNIKFIENGNFVFDGTSKEFQSSSHFIN
ncbi:MAG: ABC transporter ATP-binding protein [Bacteroidetes bacterium]|nr:ABC transporter ATP-binding protein [Bacteroidota bacterium]